MNESRQGNVDRVGLRRGDRRRQPGGLRDRDRPGPRRRPRRPGREAARPGRLQARSAPTSSRPRRCRRWIDSACSSRSSEAGGVRTTMRAWTPWGWIEAPAAEAREGVNLRRELLDPMVREAAVATPGVELMLGHSAERLVREGDTVRGVVVRDPDGAETTLSAQLVVGADGRDSRIAELAAVKTKTSRHGRFAYGAYFDGTPGRRRWSQLDLDAGPRLGGRLPDRQRARLLRGDADQGPPARVPPRPRGRPDLLRRRRAGGAADRGSRAWPARCRARSRCQTKCGCRSRRAWRSSATRRWPWTRSSGSAAAGPCSRASGSPRAWPRPWPARSRCSAGLARYRRQHRRALRGHASVINEYASGRKMQPGRTADLLRRRARPALAADFEAFGTRSIGPARFFATAIPRADRRQRASRPRRAAATGAAARRPQRQPSVLRLICVSSDRPAWSG